MRIPAVLLSLSLAVTTLATSASASAEYPSSLNLRSGMTSLLFGVDYEQAVSADESIEIGANSFINALGVSAGVKHFFSPGQKEYFVHAQGAYLFNFYPDSSGLGIAGLSGGYRFFKDTDRVQLDVELGVDVFFPSASSGGCPGLLPLAGLSVGYRF